MENIEGKVVAITGASSGIGRAIAMALAKNGAKVVLGARRTEQLQQLVEEVKSKGGVAIDPSAIANGVIYALSRPDDVEVGDIVIRPSKQN